MKEIKASSVTWVTDVDTGEKYPLFKKDEKEASKKIPEYLKETNNPRMEIDDAIAHNVNIVNLQKQLTKVQKELDTYKADSVPLIKVKEEKNQVVVTSDAEEEYDSEDNSSNYSWTIFDELSCNTFAKPIVFIFAITAALVLCMVLMNLCFDGAENAVNHAWFSITGSSEPLFKETADNTVADSDETSDVTVESNSTEFVYIEN